MKTNFISDQFATDFAKLYATDNLKGGHLITLGPDNEAAALEAVKSFPKWIASSLQVGGGIYKDNWQTETNLLINQSLLEMLRVTVMNF